MSIVTELQFKAEREHLKLDNRRRESVSELEKIEKQAAEFKAVILSASGSHERLLQFKPFINGEAQCPRCWIVHSIHSNLKSGVASKIELDLYECRSPGCKFFVEVKA